MRESSKIASRLIRLDWGNVQISKVLAGVFPEPSAGSIALWGPWAFCFGIAFWFAPHSEPAIWLVPFALALSSIAVLWVGFQRRSSAKLFFCLAMICAMFLGMGRAEWRGYNKAAQVMPSGARSWVVTGKLNKIDREIGHRARYLIRVQKIEGINPEQLPKYVRVGGFSGDAKIGSVVRFLARLEPPRQAVVPGGFSFSRNAWFQQIGGTGFTLGHLEVLVEPKINSNALRLFKLRYDLSAAIRNRMPGQSGALAAALITGDRSAIKEETSVAFREAGLGHLLAISGLHMSLVGGLAFFIASLLFSMIPAIGARMDARKPAAIIGLIVSFSYLMISGATAPTQRAFIMLGLIFLAVLLGRRALSIRTISMAALLVAILSPEYVVSPGFQMSFAASLALIAFYQRARPMLLINTQKAANSSVIFSGLRKGTAFLLGVLLTSLIAGIATAPFASWHFHKIAVYSLLGNLLAMPVFTILVMPFLFIGVCLMPLGLEGVFFDVTSIGLHSILQTSKYTADLPGAIWAIGSVSSLSLLLESMALIMVCIAWERLKYVGLVLVLVSMMVRTSHVQPNVWLDQKGGVILPQTGQGAMPIVFGKPNKFALRLFFEAVGMPDAANIKIQKSENAQCDANGCTYNLGSKLISIRSFGEDVETDCQFADLIVVPGSLSMRQLVACENVQIMTLSKDTGAMVYLQENQWVTKYPKSDRIWDRAARKPR